MPTPIMDHSQELAVLTRAIAFKNLSAAAMNIGLSQPQLSRIIARLEAALKLTLLDRESKRKSRWTPVAYTIAESYSKSMKRLAQEIQALDQECAPEIVRVGALEGLIPMAVEFCHSILQTQSVKQVHLSVHDLSDLEKEFSGGDLDLVFTSREPGKSKFRFIKTVGHQSLVVHEKKGIAEVLSTYEFDSRVHRRRKEPRTKTLVSNSLAVRKAWFEEYGGRATIPSAVRARKEAAASEPVILVGAEHLSEKVWDLCKLAP